LIVLFVLSCGKDAGLFTKEEVVARVNDTKITARELTRYYKTLVPSSQDGAASKVPVSMDLKEALLERLIEEKLLLLEAAKEGITVSDEEVDQLYAGIAKDYGNNFEAFLKKFHLSPEEWKKSLRQDLLIDKVIKRHMKSVNDVTKEEIEKFYQSHQDEFKIPMQYHIFQIVVPTRKLAEQIIDKLNKGEKFKELAKQFSIFPEGKRGGNLGYWRDDRLPEEFAVVRQMRVGQISRILKSPYGYHIIELKGVKEARVLSLKEAGARIAQKLRQEKKEKEKERWLKELKEKARIVRYTKVLEKVTFNEGRNR